MRYATFSIVAAILVSTACSGPDEPRPTINAPAFSKGAANPGTVLDLTATYTTSAPTYYSDGRSVAGAPDVVRTFSVSWPVPTVVGQEIDCPLYEVVSRSSRDMYVDCLYGIDMPLMFSAKCGFEGIPGPLPATGVLIARMTSSLSTATFSRVVAHFQDLSGFGDWSIVGLSAPQDHVSLLLSPEDADRLVAILRSRYAIPYGDAQGKWFLASDKSTTDIPTSATLPQDLFYIATHIGNGDALSSPNPADLLALLGSQSLVDLARTLSPAFNVLIHANHPACRAADKIVPVEIPFTETVNFVSTPSGNQNLIFSAGLNEPALHYNAQRGLTSGSGSLLSNDGRFSLDLSQFTGSSLPVIDNLMTGRGVDATACLVAKPEQCTAVMLQRK